MSKKPVLLTNQNYNDTYWRTIWSVDDNLRDIRKMLFNHRSPYNHAIYTALVYAADQRHLLRDEKKDI